MGKVEINSNTAQQYASAIGNASDSLPINDTVSFSKEVTTQGNDVANNQYAKLTKAVSNAQQMLNRDIATIHSVVTDFKRMDADIKKAIEINPTIDDSTLRGIKE